MHESIFDGIEEDIIYELMTSYEMILESRLDNNAFHISSTQIEKINQDVFDEMFLRVNQYENSEYKIFKSAVKVENEGWHYYMFAHKVSCDDIDWKRKNIFAQSILKYQYKIADYLTNLARKKQTVSYRTFHRDLLDISNQNLNIFAGNGRLDNLAWDIVEYICHDLRGKEMLNLSGLIITKQGIPADGFFDVMKTWNVYNGIYASKEEFHKWHLEKLHAKYVTQNIY